MVIKNWIFAALIVALALAYEIIALNSADLWEWSEILNRLADYPFLIAIICLFVGIVIGHALVPHKSRFR